MFYMVSNLFMNTFVGGKQLTKIATEGSQPQKYSTKIKPLPSDSVIFENNCKYDNINISLTCETDTTDDIGICNLFNSRSSLTGPENFTSTFTYQYSHFPCRTWKIIDTNNKKIKLHFNGFHDNTCCSELTIFDGPDPSYHKLFSKNNEQNYHVPVNITSSGSTLYLYYVSNISLTSSEVQYPGFHMSYSPEREDDSYHYDYSNDEVDYIVLDLPDYYDDEFDAENLRNNSNSQKLESHDTLFQNSYSKNPNINIIVRPREPSNIPQDQKSRNVTLGNICLHRKRK